MTDLTDGKNSPTTPTDPYDSEEDDADILLLQVAEISERILTTPSSSDLYYQRGVVNLKFIPREYEKAFSDFNKSIELDSTNSKAFYCRGLLYDGYFSDHPKALSDYNTAIKLSPDFPEVLHERANLHEKLEMYVQAEKDYTKLISLNLQDYEAYHNRGLLYKNHFHNYDQALKDYNKALFINPDFYEGFYNRAILYQDNLNDYQKALDDYTRAVKINPSDYESYFNRALLYENKFGKYDKALQDYNYAITISDKDDIVFLCRGTILKKNFQRYDDAVKDYDKAIEINPQGCYEAHLYKALIYEQNFKKYEMALECYNKAIEINPNDHEIYVYLALLYLNKIKDVPKALKNFSLALEVNPKHQNETTLVEIYFNRANVYWKEVKDYESALMDYNKLIELNPRNEVFYFNRAELYENHFKYYDLALEDYTTVTKINRSFYEAHRRKKKINSLIEKNLKEYRSKYKLSSPEYNVIQKSLKREETEMNRIVQKQKSMLNFEQTRKSSIEKNENNKEETPSHIIKIGNILKELIATEIVYLRNMKSLFENLLILEQKQKDLMEIRLIKASVESILRVNFLFVNGVFDAKTKKESPNEDNSVFNPVVQIRIVDFIVSFFESKKFNFYFLFIDSFNNFMAFVKKKEKIIKSILHLRSSTVTFSDLLIRPIQRIPRYQLLLEQIAKIGRGFLHEDKVKLIEKFAAEINRKEKTRKNSKMIVDIRQKFPQFKMLVNTTINSSSLKLVVFGLKELYRHQNVDLFLFEGFVLFTESGLSHGGITGRHQRIQSFTSSFKRKTDYIEIDFEEKNAFVFFIVFEDFVIFRINYKKKKYKELHLLMNEDFLMELNKLRKEKCERIKVIFMNLEKIMHEEFYSHLKDFDIEDENKSSGKQQERGGMNRKKETKARDEKRVKRKSFMATKKGFDKVE